MKLTAAMQYKYENIVEHWCYSKKNYLLLKNWFIDKEFIKDNIIDYIEIECARQQLIAIREGLTD